MMARGTVLFLMMALISGLILCAWAPAWAEAPEHVACFRRCTMAGFKFHALGCDVLVIGGGGAGLRAAIACRETGMPSPLRWARR